MNSITELVFTAGLASLLIFLVLFLPLLYLLSGSLRPWFEQMAAARALDPGMMVVRDAPPARRTAPGRRTASARSLASGRRPVSGRRPARKLTISPKRTAFAKPAKKKTAKKKAPAKKKAAVAKRKAPKRKVATKKRAAAKPKATAKPKAAARSKTVAKPKAAPTGAKMDAKLGVIYSKKPKQVDDLKKISGVAKVLEGRLHSAGVYTYQQIADWKPAQMEAFGEVLSFKGRIQRDDWKKQAKALMKKLASAKK